MADFETYLKAIGKSTPNYYFLVNYQQDGVQAEPANPEDSEKALAFYHSLTAEQAPYIQLCIAAIVDGEKYERVMNISEDECLLMKNDLKLWEGKKQALKISLATRLALSF